MELVIAEAQASCASGGRVKFGEKFVREAAPRKESSMVVVRKKVAEFLLGGGPKSFVVCRMLAAEWSNPGNIGVLSCRVATKEVGAAVRVTAAELPAPHAGGRCKSQNEDFLGHCCKP